MFYALLRLIGEGGFEDFRRSMRTLLLECSASRFRQNAGISIPMSPVFARAMSGRRSAIVRGPEAHVVVVVRPHVVPVAVEHPRVRAVVPVGGPEGEHDT